jgi:hypothetical protein
MIKAFDDRPVERWRGGDRLGAWARLSINRIKIQFLNHARRPWYTKLLINRVS